MFGIYLHWPFCLSKCIYCDFGSIVVDKEKFSLAFQKTYAECCKKQLFYFKSKINRSYKDRHISSIYFGGGTPSLINVDVVKDLIVFIKQEFDLAEGCEITIEANPTSCCFDKFEKLRQCGVNRISIGVQSFNDINLSFLGRKHSSKEAIRTIEDAKKIFPKWSFDLIYGLPRQDLEKWLEELQFAMEFQPQHISLYTIIIEKNTLLEKMVKNGIVVPKSDDEMSVFYDATNDFFQNSSCSAEKIRQYEISNYAIQGYESQHNMTYWKYHDYIGVGAGANGRVHYLCPNERFETISINKPQEWISCVQNGGSGLVVENKLSKKEIAEEVLIMGLRTIYGIDVLDVKKRFDLDIMYFINLDEFYKFINDGYLNFNNNIIRLTKYGINLLDSIVYKITT